MVGSANHRRLSVQVVFCIYLVVVSSCSKGDYSPFRDAQIVYEEIEPTNNISMNDIYSVLERDIIQIKSNHNSPNYRVTPLIGKDADTLLFIVNYGEGDGWKIFSTDKRTPAVLAEGSKGSFSLRDGSPALAVWMGYTADNMARIKQSADSELSFSEEEILLNRAYWTGKYPKQVTSKSRFDPPYGHWEETVYAETEFYDEVGHLVAKWDQGRPYNECCPYLTGSQTDRAAAGCVAIAGSQMLLYLHNTIGLPLTMYSQGFCVGEVGNYTQYFSNPTNTVWSQMSTNYQSYSSSMLPEAIMIGAVGMAVNMHYWDVGNDYFSWALPGNLKTGVFEPSGISCTREGYDEDIVRTSLLAQMPVIVSGSNLLIPVDGRIHCFVIDGYKRTRKKYTHHFEFVYDEFPSGPVPNPPEGYDLYTYSTPVLSSIKINWGWWTQWDEQNPVNDGDFALTAGWTVTNSGQTYNYNYYLNMTHGFSVMSQ